MTDQVPPSSFDAGEQVQRRAEPRLRLGIPALFDTLEGQKRIRLVDLSQGGAHIAMPDDTKVRAGVLTWMRFEVFADVVWQKGKEIGVEFDRPVSYEKLIETRNYAPAVVRQEEIDAARDARDFVAGKLHNGAER